MHPPSHLYPFFCLVLCGLIIVSAACAPAGPTSPPLTQASTAAPTKTQPVATATIAPLKLTPTATQPIPQPPAATVEGSFPFGYFKNEKLPITLVFLAGGKFSIQTPPFGSFSGGIDSGIYTLAGNQITIEQFFSPDVKGTYTWTYDGKALNFKSFGDKNTEREFQLEIGPYGLQP